MDSMTRERTTEQRLTDWLVSEAPTELADRVLAETFEQTSATRQVRALPGWRTFPVDRKFISFAAGAAAIAVVVIAGAAYFGQGGSSTVGGVPSPTPTPAPEISLTPGIPEWLPYTSAVHGIDLGLPADWSSIPATRTWQAGDAFPADAAEMPFADIFVGPGEGDDSVGFFVWDMPTEEGADLGSWEGLMAVADTLCTEIVRPSCEDFTQRAVPMCNRDGGRECEAAIIVPTAGAQYAFFRTWGAAMLSMDEVTVVVVGREDDHPSVARYGGSEALLKSILTRMDVVPPRPGQVPD
jgi:hypothetical protein